MLTVDACLILRSHTISPNTQNLNYTGSVSVICLDNPVSVPQVRCFLQLLEQGINNLKHWVFASPEQPGQTPVVLGMTVGRAD